MENHLHNSNENHNQQNLDSDRKFVIFDLDGTLIDSFECVLRCVNKALMVLEYDLLSDQDVIGIDNVGDLLNVVQLKIDQDSYIEFKTVFDDILSKETITSEITKNSAAVLFINYLKKKYPYCKVIVLTNKLQKVADNIVLKHFSDIVDVVIGRKSITPLKNSYELVKKRIFQNGFKIENGLLYCGDSIEDEHLAAKLNLKFIYCDFIKTMSHLFTHRNSSLSLGLNYITSLITTFRILSRDSFITSPRYIFRGITQRHFTSSSRLESLLQKLKSNSNLSAVENEIISIIRQSNHNPETIQTEELYEILNQTSNFRINNNIYNQVESIDYSSYLLSIINKPKYFFKYIEPLFIRSSCAVRLNGQMDEYRQIDYLWYLRNLITEAQRMYPEYSNQNDLAILADLQHKGASTCLVDFSRNILVALWFATQDYNSIEKETGYLFCYDINSDAITKDNIEIVNTNSKEERTIEEVLQCTRKSVKYDGNDSYKFVVWTPSNLNSRIVRQDSVFILGIEKFEISAHPVITIPIPHCWKKSIQTALKTFFGISSESLYADNGGFASSNSKKDSLAIKSSYFNEQLFDNNGVNHINKFDLFQKGTGCLMKGNYLHALDYFVSFEAVNKFSQGTIDKSIQSKNDILTHIIHLECLYSKALCYKHISGEAVTAQRLYKEALERCEKLLKPGIIDLDNVDFISSLRMKDSVTRMIDYLTNKRLKILDDYIGILLDLKYHKRAYDVISDFMAKFKPARDEVGQSTIIMLQTAKAEIITLAKLQGNPCFKKHKLNEYYQIESSNRHAPLCALLNRFFAYICDMVDNPSHKKCEDSLNKIITQYENSCKIFQINSDKNLSLSQCSFVRNLFSEWDLSDIKIAISEYCKRSPQKRQVMLEMLSYVDRFRRLIEGYRSVEAY